MNKSRIEWCDFTWNPVTGCRHNCPYCYARSMCRRFAVPWGLDPADPFKPTFHPERLDEPLRLKKPSRIFVGSMCDLFGEWMFEGEKGRWYILEILERIERCPQHTFIFLTKNPRRYAEFDFPPNCWLGVTVTGFDDPSLIRAGQFVYGTVSKTNLRFVSWEPILGPIFASDTYIKDFDIYQWLILGAMTGPGAKKYAPDPRWIADAVAQCRERGIPVFMKNSIRPYWEGELIQEWPKP